GGCGTGWFGNYCQYKCHCKNSACDTNGDCVNVTCERGWFGYKCQYQDLSSLADTSHPSLVDGDDATCNEDAYSSSVSLNLNTSFIFTWMRLVFKLKDPVLNVTVVFQEKESQQCHGQRILQVSENTLDIYCTMNMKIQQINITGHSIKYLCSVYLSGGRNVAIKQPTIQTTTYIDSKGTPTGSENAVDGNADSYYQNGSCSHTLSGTPPPTWSVRFNTSFVVNRFVLYNRDFPAPSLVPQRLQNFTLVALNDFEQIELLYQDQEPNVLQVYTVNEYIRNPISQVNISTAVKSSNHLTLCEVEIYGDCPEGKFGLDCNQTFDARCGHHCSMDNGSCNYICIGFSNPPECCIACRDDQWGDNCNNNCSTKCCDAVCNVKETGKNEMTFGAGMGIGFALGVVVIATLQIIVLIIYRVRKKMTSTGQENKDFSNDVQQAYDGVNQINVDVHAYEESSSPELKGDKLKDTSKQTSQYSNAQSTAYENL
ncbi:cell death abnormality protein 1, partial [Biomphalaria glabrata]